MKQPRSVGVHDHTFHADEVTACALLSIYGLIDSDKIVRTRDTKKLLECEFVCDVGGVYDPDRKLFDHHQSSYEGPLSSAGMVLRYLFDSGTIKKDIFNHLNHTLVLGIDAHDNGCAPQDIGVCTMSHVIANFNPIQHEASAEQFEKAFMSAFEFVVSHLRRVNERFAYVLSCKKKVKKAMEDQKVCLFFDEALPWLENFFALGGEKHSALFVIMPTGNHWKLRGIPPDYDNRMKVRMPLPKKWAGLLGEELQKVSGIEGAVFCHKGRFTSVWETRDGAIKALNYVLQKVKDENAL